MIHTSLKLRMTGLKKYLNLILLCALAATSAVHGMDNNRKRKRTDETLLEEKSAKRVKYTSLFDAAAAGDIDAVRALIFNVADIDEVLTGGPYAYQAALHGAAKNGHVDVVKLLLASGANVNIEIKNTGITPLFIAIKNGHAEVVRELCKHPNINFNIMLTQGPDAGATALYVAAQNGHVEVVRELLKHPNIDINVARMQGSHAGATALYAAVFYGHVEVVRELLKHPNIKVNAAITDGLDAELATLLNLAAYNGRVDVVNFLLTRINTKVTTDGFSIVLPAFNAAVYGGHVDVVKLLLARINANEVEAYGLEALYTATEKGHVEIVRSLLADSRINLNAVPNRGPNAGLTLLHVAALQGHVDIVKLLLTDSRININVVPNHGIYAGLTTLHLAALHAHIEIVYCLLKKVSYGDMRTTLRELNIILPYRPLIAGVIIKKMIEKRSEVKLHGKTYIEFCNDKILHYAQEIKINKDEFSQEQVAFLKDQQAIWEKRKEVLEQYFDNYVHRLIKEGASNNDMQCQQILLLGPDWLPFRSKTLSEIQQNMKSKQKLTNTMPENLSNK